MRADTLCPARESEAAVEILVASLMLLIAVLASNLVSKLIPYAATPLVQIVIGAVLALFVRFPADFQLPNELFLMLFVAPLVYADSRGIDRLVAWRNRKTILVLSIGLVLATTLTVGGVMGSALVPQLPLGAAFVLGAALSPTDAVAVPALARTSSIALRERTILTAESIVNDATGVVVFNLALAALISGSFSPAAAGASFLYLFFGGIAVGLLTGLAANLLTSLAQRLGVDDVVFHVLFEVLLPFIAFLAGESLGVSPIMAVMVCAIIFKLGIGQAGPAESRVSIVSNSVWNVLSFALNGFVFIMLGFQLKDSLAAVVATGIGSLALAAMIAIVIALVIGVRFLWLLAMERHAGRGLRSAAVLTFAGGTKGAVTMSIALSIPYSVAARDLVVFLVSTVIIASTVLANVLVPLLAPATETARNERREAERRAKIEILRGVIERLHSERTLENAAATRAVIADYNKRIRAMGSDLLDASDVSQRAVRERALELEADCVGALMESGAVPKRDGYLYLAHVERLAASLGKRGSLSWTIERGKRRARGVMKARITQTRDRVRRLLNGTTDEAGATAARSLQRKCAEYVIEHLSQEVQQDRYPVEDVTQVIAEYRRSIELLDASNPSLTTLARQQIQENRIKLRAVDLELEGIRNAYDDGEIPRDAAMRMRDSAYLMRLDLENLL